MTTRRLELWNATSLVPTISQRVDDLAARLGVLRLLPDQLDWARIPKIMLS